MDIHNWLHHRTIYLVQHGSRAYGTHTETSDYDYRGVAIPPKQYFLGFDKFEQSEFKKDNEETVIYEIRKFITLAADGNPNMTELLFVDPMDRIKMTPISELLLSNRNLFLSKKMRHTFSGYAMAQLKRIETHRKWLLNPPKAPPTRKEFGLLEVRTIPKEQFDIVTSLIKKKIESWNLHLDNLDDAEKIEIKEHVGEVLIDMQLSKDTEQFHTAGITLGFDHNFMTILEAERNFANAQKNWQQYQGWIKNRNIIRSQLEATYGYDCKHGMHLVRLMRMCREILETGEVYVKRPDAKELLSIRNGAWSYEKLIDWAKKEDADLNEAYKKSSLPYAPDHQKINELCIELIEMIGW